MKLNAFLLCCIFSTIYFSCDGNKDEPFVATPVPIDLSVQWKITSGTNYKTENDSQWLNQVLKETEMNLFKLLDTANLEGTVFPGTISDSKVFPFYPNPFTISGNIEFQFPTGFDKELVFKYIVVDNMSLPLDSKAIRFQAKAFSNGTSFGRISFLPNIQNGQYRIYYSLSAKDHKQFFTSWGNIQRGN